jgi:hypothetical protein
MAMSRWCYVVLCGFLVGVSLAGAAEPKVVGDPTGTFHEKLEGVWFQGDSKAPDRVELEFTWQRIGRQIARLGDGGPEWVKRPAILSITHKFRRSSFGASYGGRLGPPVSEFGVVISRVSQRISTPSPRPPGVVGNYKPAISLTTYCKGE